MDETLVRCSMNKLYEYDTSMTIDCKDNTFTYYISFRPYLFEFLSELHDLYEIVLFTAAEPWYAQHVVKEIDPKNWYFDYWLFRESWDFLSGTYIKNLSILGRPWSKTIIVDNSLWSFAWNLNNGIPILDYFGDKNDIELKYLKNDLIKLHNLVTWSVNPRNSDIRTHLNRKYTNFINKIIITLFCTD